MHLRSITLKGFKSFAERTHLDFGPGVSVVVGPNGSGKSNVTDAVLWALGEQSPLAVRGQSMQDVIFGGGRGVPARQAAEVEIVLENEEGRGDLPFSQISILRRLNRNGEGEYRLNGAHCRLVDVIEVLSDTGLGKEMHSVISQGRVESIVTSKPRDRRMLIEEAAGLGKHRKRRRRAQLKLERTQENLDRALDVEREARSRLRPLKRQAEAAELHERLQRQTDEARYELARDALRHARVELAGAEAVATSARAAREQAERELANVTARREAAEGELAARGERRERLSGRVYGARTASERLALRREHAQATTQALQHRGERMRAELEVLGAVPASTDADAVQADRITALEEQLQQLDREREVELEHELTELTAAHERAVAAAEGAARRLDASLQARREADERADSVRAALRGAERGVEAARREAARVGAELAAVNQFLRAHASAPGGGRALSDRLGVEAGLELALAAALGGRLGAALADDRPGAARLLEGCEQDGGSALVVPRAGELADSVPPAPDARRLATLVQGDDAAVALARRLLADVWLVERLEDVAEDFRGVAVTPAGRVWTAWGDGSDRWGELRQVAQGGAELVLARRNERSRLVAASEAAAQAEVDALAAADRVAADVHDADAARTAAEGELREAQREQAEASEEARRAQWLIDERRRAPQAGPLAVRRAELEGELAAERRQAERAHREAAQRAERVRHLRAQLDSDAQLAPLCGRLIAALDGAGEAVAAHLAEAEQALAADVLQGADVAERLRACAGEEATIQARLREASEQVTGAEVGAQRVRDAASESEADLVEVAQRLELVAEPAEQALPEEQREALTARLERLARRREQLGPVNPLARDEYAEAVAHVEELEERRADLETALRELRTLIRDTDREIEQTFNETFAAAAENFEQLIGDVFPGGGGRMRLVADDSGPRRVLGGQEDEPVSDEDEEREELQGVELEITPAGKSAKRLSLLSGGEKSMTALAFLFAVFLARPCPFYILDEVEAALDDVNLTRFLDLLRRHRDRAQFIVITHQRRTMEAADWLYGVSMGGDGVSKVVSRRLPADAPVPTADAPVPTAATG